jgi:hypothetical protein
LPCLQGSYIIIVLKSPLWRLALLGSIFIVILTEAVSLGIVFVGGIHPLLKIFCKELYVKFHPFSSSKDPYNATCC